MLIKNRIYHLNPFLSNNAKALYSWGRYMPSSRLSGLLNVLISHASKRHRVRQPGLVRKIPDDSHFSLRCIFLLPLKKAYVSSRNVGILRSFFQLYIFLTSVTFSYFTMQPPGYKSVFEKWRMFHFPLIVKRWELTTQIPLNKKRSLLFRDCPPWLNKQYSITPRPEICLFLSTLNT